MTRPTKSVAAVAVAALLACGCHRTAPEANADAGASAPPPDHASALPFAPERATDPNNGVTRQAPAAGEAERRVVTIGSEDPLLRPYATRIRNHFKDAKSPLLVQRASLFGGGTAIFIRQDVDVAPLLLVEDRERTLLWDKERPTVAMLPPVRDPVIIGRGSGGVALFAYDVPARVVAGRLLDPDGTPFADLTVMRAADCQWMSAAHWPKHGIVVVCARTSEAGGNRLQIVRGDNTIGLDPEGVPVGSRTSRVASPISIGFDSDDTMMLAQIIKAKTDGRDHLQVFRYDAAGIAKWPQPYDQTEVGDGGGVFVGRIEVAPATRPGSVSLKGLVALDSNGAIVR